MAFKRLLRQAFAAIGFEVRRLDSAARPASPQRPIGELKSFLEDVKARRFLPFGILDVGANRGDWTRLALSIFPDARVILVEPQDEMEVVLKKFCAESASCQYVKAAVGRFEGSLVQTIWDDLAGSSFLPQSEPSKLAAGKQRLTKVTTINEVLTQNIGFQPDLVKLDIQGFELEAMSGGSKLFGATELFILETSLFPFMEGQPVTREIVEFMHERGYELYDVIEYIRRPYDGALGQVDLAFAKRDGILRADNRWSYDVSGV